MKVRTLNGEEVTAWQILEDPGGVNRVAPGIKPLFEDDTFCFLVQTVGGTVKAHAGDWIISAPYDGLSVMSAAEFEKAFGSA